MEHDIVHHGCHEATECEHRQHPVGCADARRAPLDPVDQRPRGGVDGHGPGQEGRPEVPRLGNVLLRERLCGEVCLDEADIRDAGGSAVEHWFWSVDRIHPSAEGHRLIAAAVAELLGVPVDTAEPVAASGTAVLRRYAVEAAWLARYGLRVSAHG